LILELRKRFYKQGGATEYAAQSSAGKVQEKEYQASNPYNINNIPTYVTLKDKGGLVKMFAMVAISDYTIVGVEILCAKR
jgi:hypothetical protein